MDSFGSRKEVKEEPPIESVAQTPQECLPCVQAPKPLLELGALTCAEPHPPHSAPQLHTSFLAGFTSSGSPWF